MILSQFEEILEFSGWATALKDLKLIKTRIRLLSADIWEGD